MNRVYSVSEVSTYIQNILKNDPILNNVWVEGEISNFNKNTSGHVYFKLKDDKALISCVIFKTMDLAKKIKLKDGDRVKLRASIATYQRASSYQLIVKEIEENGKGDIYKKYIDLKNDLEERGFFSLDHKKEINKFPSAIGIVTSSTGAAVNDICRTIKRRYPICDIYIYHAQVQGDGASQSIIEGIKYLDLIDLDTIIVGRGGGSFEDLNAFNDEELLMTIFNAKTPIISAVGHENDFMLTDFIADLRASTPTGAGELATVDINQIFEFLNKVYRTLNLNITSRFADERSELDYYGKQLDFYNPQNSIDFEKEHLKEFKNAIKKNYNKNLMDLHNSELNYFKRLNSYIPLKQISQEQKDLKQVFYNINLQFYENFSFKKLELKAIEEKLELLNSKNILNKGYAKILKDDKDVKSVKDVNIRDEISLILSDGKLLAEVMEKEEY
ncbi:MAG: exodeoxyribonuclease VII large subunit [Finegoldia sp.]|nr:exodeoxyribonuclease VII large subunit [Finegoldia sp.]